MAAGPDAALHLLTINTELLESFLSHPPGKIISMVHFCYCSTDQQNYITPESICERHNELIRTFF